jgi:hypothetical protein
MLWIGSPFVWTLALVPRCPPEQRDTIIGTVAPISRFAKKTKISALTFLSIVASCPRHRACTVAECSTVLGPPPSFLSTATERRRRPSSLSTMIIVHRAASVLHHIRPIAYVPF